MCLSLSIFFQAAENRIKAGPCKRSIGFKSLRRGHPTSGTMLFRGEPAFDRTSLKRRRRTAMVFQEPLLLADR
jgi:hypothetical protein